MKHSIVPHVAQDAYWYAECVANNGAGGMFSAGRDFFGREIYDGPYKATLTYRFRQAVKAAKEANINLSGLNLCAGEIAHRGAALMQRIREECAKQAIEASRGMTIKELCCYYQHTAEQVVTEYGLQNLVPPLCSCGALAVAGYSDRIPSCEKCWTERSIG